MSWFANLRIGAKFNLIMSILLLFLFIAAALLTYNRQQSLILKVAADNARNSAKQIIETRDYISGVVRDEPERNYALVPQVVATQVAKRMTSGSKYYVRQVSLRYRNPDNRPDAYETDHLRAFAGREVRESYNVIAVRGEKVFRYMQPMVAEKSCLGCHGAYDEAPAFVRARFPRGHYSYNYRLGEVIGAVSVSVPMTELYREIGTNLELDLISRGGIFLIIMLIMGAVVRRHIISPIETVSQTISNVAATGNFSKRISHASKDEIGRLSEAFNELMAELGQKTQQSRESEERYRNMIEMAQSAVITFMEDGKIVIANRKAEELFGLAKQALLGEVVFSFLADGDVLKEGIAEYLSLGRGGEVGATAQHRVRNVNGVVTDVEFALSASMTDHKPLFTAILRRITS